MPSLQACERPFDVDTFRRTLRAFTSSRGLYWNRLGLRYTEGVRFLAEKLEAWWLIKAIASFQQAALQDSGLAEFQLWELIVRDGSARLICSRDSEDKVFQHRYRRTACPIDYLRLYVKGGVLMLPSER